jgi:aerobic-type carbon monoxide dehydrogenase small subunit (CoxS/CutS family)
MTPTSALTLTVDRCPVCGEPTPAEARWWTLKSHHRISEGELEYCASGCGCLVVLVNGEIVKSLPATRR